MAGLGDLIIRLLADTADFESDMGKAAHVAEREMERMVTRASAAGELIGRSIGAIANHFADAAKQAVEFGDTLSKMNQRTGVSVERLSEIAFAGDLADVSVSQLNAGLGQFNKVMADAAKQGSKASEMFKALGVNITQGPQVAFDQFAVAINSLPDGETKVAAMRAAFGRAGDSLIPLIAGLDEATEKARKLGLVMSTQMAQDAERFNDAMTVLGTSARSLALTALQPLTGWLANVSEGMARAKADGNLFKNSMLEIGMLLASLWGGLAEKIGATPFANAMEAEFRRFKKLQDEMNAANEGGASTAKAAANVDANALTKALANVKDKKGKSKQGDANFLARQLQEGMDEDAKIMSEASAAADKMNVKLRERQALEEKWGDTFENMTTDEIKDWEKRRFAALDALTEIEEAQMRLAGGFDENGRVIDDNTKKISDAARELGMTFSSAFEDAIVGGKKFSDVLKGLEQDIIRIVTRKMVTEPLADWVGGALGAGKPGGGIDFGKIGSTLMSWLPSFDVGTDYVPRDMMAMVHKGEAIIPAAQNRGGGAGGPMINMTVVTRDAGSFNASRGQVLAGLQAASSIAMRRNK